MSSSTHINYLVLAIALTFSMTALSFGQEQPVRSKLKNLRTARAQTGAGTAVEVAPPANIPVSVQAAPIVSSNRTTRTADVFQNGDGYNIFVTNTCERESMNVNIKTSRPFYGAIHTSNQRKRPACTVEGDGSDEYNLVINHVLNQNDPGFCGVVRARKESPEDKDMLSVVVVVRLHRNIELSDDKFFLLNCTNRCRRTDCAKPSANLEGPDGSPNSEENNNTGEREETIRGNGTIADECTIWRFPWVITLLWCLGILLLAMIISHCIMCSSLVCRCVKTEVEEKEPSVYEGATDYEDDQYNKRHPYRIEYDNRDIYKTSNNYEPYCLEETQTKSRHKTRPKH